MDLFEDVNDNELRQGKPGVTTVRRNKTSGRSSARSQPWNSISNVARLPLTRNPQEWRWREGGAEGRKRRKRRGRKKSKRKKKRRKRGRAGRNGRRRSRKKKRGRKKRKRKKKKKK